MHIDGDEDCEMNITFLFRNESLDLWDELIRCHLSNGTVVNDYPDGGDVSNSHWITPDSSWPSSGLYYSSQQTPFMGGRIFVGSKYEKDNDDGGDGKKEVVVTSWEKTLEAWLYPLFGDVFNLYASISIVASSILILWRDVWFQ